MCLWRRDYSGCVLSLGRYQCLLLLLVSLEDHRRAGTACQCAHCASSALIAFVTARSRKERLLRCQVWIGSLCDCECQVNPLSSVGAQIGVSSSGGLDLIWHHITTFRQPT